MLDVTDVLGRHEDVAAGDAGHGAAHRRVLVLAEANEEVVDAPELAAVGVGQIAADDEREVEDRGRGGHGSR